MTDTRSFIDAVHEASHRVPGVPAHADRPTGHQGEVRHGRAGLASMATGRRRPGRTWNHSSARPPRVLVAWQRRIAAFFGQQS
ncbi:hypothetical protein [Agromyces larvae]|uniref:Uncharacterized protein n=1 Tax=Agromyces larvae TaxID=2929802 RepID=A0ABY4C0D6_9MICO|nr:hypothetical protein [Agromyces larvae]UOE44824.1 hypothetical protein MTO99_03295 [Agromyces larvae]